MVGSIYISVWIWKKTRQNNELLKGLFRKKSNGIMLKGTASFDIHPRFFFTGCPLILARSAVIYAYQARNVGHPV